MDMAFRFCLLSLIPMAPTIAWSQPGIAATYDVFSCAGMIEYREAHQLVWLQPVNDFDEGWILAVGGSDGDQVLATAEIGVLSPDDIAPYSWDAVGSMSTPRQDFVAVSWGGGHAMAIGGFDGNQVLSSTEVFNAETGSWSPGPEMTIPRTHHRAVWLDGERLLITGGFDGVAETASCEILNVVTGATEAVAPMNMARASHTLTSGGEEGGIMVAGGFNANQGFQLASSELYSPVSGTWTEAGDLPVARDNHAAVFMGNGHVVTGGRVFNADENLFEGLAEGAWHDGEMGEWVAFDMEYPHSYHGMGGGNTGIDGPASASPWWCLGGVDASGIGVETTYGVAEWGSFQSDNWVSYAWEEGGIGSGQNPSLLNARYKAAMVETEAGWIVTGGDAEGIGTCAVVSGPLTEVREMDGGTGIRLIPNPAVGRVVIVAPGFDDGTGWNVLDVAGRPVQSGSGQGLDVTGWSVGPYVLQVHGMGAVRFWVAPVR